MTARIRRQEEVRRPEVGDDLRQIHDALFQWGQGKRVGRQAGDHRWRGCAPVEKAAVVGLAVGDELGHRRVGPPGAGEGGERDAAAQADHHGQDHERPPFDAQFGSSSQPDEAHGSFYAVAARSVTSPLDPAAGALPMVVSRVVHGCWPYRRMKIATPLAWAGVTVSRPVGGILSSSERSLGGHPSERPTWGASLLRDRTSSPSPTLGLAPGGVYRAGGVTPAAGALLPHPFTLTCAGRAARHRRFPFCGTVLRVTPTGR